MVSKHPSPTHPLGEALLLRGKQFSAHFDLQQVFDTSFTNTDECFTNVYYRATVLSLQL